MILSGVPDLPTNVRLMVTGSDNITVTFDEPLRSNGAMVTKYRSELTEISRRFYWRNSVH